VPHVLELPSTIPAELVPEFLSKLHYVSEDLASFALDPDRADRVHFETRAGGDGSAEQIGARIREVAGKLCDGHRGFQKRILIDRKRATYGHRENPRAALETGGHLFEFGPGRFGMGPLLVWLEDYFEVGLLRMADRLGAARHRFPALIGVDVLDRCGYLRSFPHSLTLASHLREDLGAIRRFASEYRVADGVLAPPAESVAAPKCLLAPTICFHHYTHLRDRRLDTPQTITAVGHCFRYESGNMATLERLWDFTMREVVFVGPQEYVLAQRDSSIRMTDELLQEWGLGYEISTATDPFFIEQYSSQTAFQASFELKFEIRADLPYTPGKTAAIGSFNFHQDFFGRSLQITDAGSGDPVFTGCVGFGLERVAWAFLAQHGLDPAGWPAAVRTSAQGAIR
jgi:seryl-tRNA synthetase